MEEKEERGIQCPCLEVVFLVFYGPKWAAPPLFGENLQKISKQKLTFIWVRAQLLDHSWKRNFQLELAYSKNM
jgi:hypothetical protein